MEVSADVIINEDESSASINDINLRNVISKGNLVAVIADDVEYLEF